MKRKVWLITGCSSGFGKAIAMAAINAGNMVVTTARDIGSLDEFTALQNENVMVARLDVVDKSSISTALAAIISRFKTVDVLVNNAGYGYYNLFEQLSMEEFKKEMEVNLYGAVRTAQGVLPFMRGQRSGHIINISSIAGSLGTAGRSAYSASKFALGGIFECLAEEVREFGIKVTVIEPGAFRTNFFDKGKTIIENKIPDYKKLALRLNNQFAGINGHQKGDPKLAAEAIIKLSEYQDPPLRIPLGADAVKAMEQRLRLTNTELNDWREWAVNTAFPEE